jgi:bacillithiol biosynthesis cysteine-adding enzyme BshC
MESSCLRHTELPHTTWLFSDFTYHFERVRSFYDHAPHEQESYRAAARAIDYPPERRAALISALRQQNGDSPALEALAQPGALAVVTGQQVGLFSGPAYTIHKALTAAKLARRLTAAGIPAVPVFWLATEDHDFAEVNHCWTFDTAHQPSRIEVAPGNHSEQPVGKIPIQGDPVASLRQTLAGFPFAEETVGLAEGAYAPGQTFGSAFQSLLGRLLGSHDLLYLDPMHPAVRRLAAPLLRQAVEAARELKARVLERNRELEAAGYHAQVHVDEQTSFVFLLENGRRLTLDGGRVSDQELADRAEQLSPNALLRPVVQDYILPTVASVGGPAEVAYLAQAQVIYRTLLGRMPVAVHRSSATLLDARSATRLERYGLGLPDLFRGPEQVREQIAHRLVPPALSGAFDQTRAEATRLLENLDDGLARFDVTLAAALETSRRKILYQLEKIERKTAREAFRRNERATRDAAALSGLVYPHRHLQERFYTILPFLARHGLELIDRLYDAMQLDCPDHRVLVL